MTFRRLLLVALAASSAAAVLAPAPADAATRSISGRPAADGTASFRLAGLDPRAVRGAELRVGGARRRIVVSKVRSLAPHGIIRVRMTRKMRSIVKATGRRPRLVVALAAAAALAPASDAGNGGRISQWREPGSAPLSDAQAAERVRATREIRPANARANRYMPSKAELRAFHAARYEAGPNDGALGDDVIPQQRFVTGHFTGTTDEILQWSAHKWGIPEDILRAVAHQESTWQQNAVGDRERVRDSARYPVQARASARIAYESMGLMQIKWRPDGSLHPGTEPLRWKSTAFNVDFYGAVVRFYYDGTARSWFGARSAYRLGREWESVGAWFQPTPWRSEAQLSYVAGVKAHLAARPWQSPRY